MPRGYLLHFTARSGSTYFVFRLRNHPQIESQAEIFGEPLLPEGQEQSEENQLAFVRSFWQDFHRSCTRPPRRSRGFKLQHFYRQPHVKNLGAILDELADYDIQHIILRRENRLAQVTSSLVAQNLHEISEERSGRKTSHLFSDVKVDAEEVRARKLRIHPESILRMMDKLGRTYAILDDLEDRLPNVHSFTYEEMVAEGPAFFVNIFRMLGVDAEFPLPAEAETRKISTGNALEMFENRAQIESFIRESPHARYLQMTA